MASVLAGASVAVNCATGLSGEGPVDASASDEPSAVDRFTAESGEDTGLDAAQPDDAFAAVDNLSVDVGMDVFSVSDAVFDGTGAGSHADSGESGAAESGGAAADSGADAEETAPCSGVICNGSCLAASDCRGCSGSALLCGPSGTCVIDCSACRDTNGVSMPIDCVSCNSNHQSPLGTCQYNDSSQYCLNGDYLGSYVSGANGEHCACTVNTDCPGPTQVCAASPGGARLCVTCGEAYVYDLTGQPCANGRSCVPSTATCE